jgi:hypothetical protein
MWCRATETTTGANIRLLEVQCQHTFWSVSNSQTDINQPWINCCPTAWPCGCAPMQAQLAQYAPPYAAAQHNLTPTACRVAPTTSPSSTHPPTLHTHDTTLVYIEYKLLLAMAQPHQYLPVPACNSHQQPSAPTSCYCCCVCPPCTDTGVLKKLKASHEHAVLS